MTPLAQPDRLKAIRRWMTDNEPGLEKLPPEVLQARVEALDEQMIEAFLEREADLLTRLLRPGAMGPLEREQEQRSGAALIWREVMEEFLPTSGQSPED